MANPYLTVADVVRLACDLANNSGLNVVPADDTESRGQKLLKLICHHAFLTKDWAFNQSETTWSIAANAYSQSLSAVSLYRSIDSLIITNPVQTTTDVTLTERPWKDIWALVNQAIATTPVQTGTPQWFAVKPDKSEFWIYPVPSVAYSGKLLYYTMPNVAGWTTSTVLPFEDTQCLVTALAEVIQRWDKEQQSTLMARVADQMWADYRAAHEDQGRASARRWRWSSAYRRKPSN